MNTILFIVGQFCQSWFSVPCHLRVLPVEQAGLLVLPSLPPESLFSEVRIPDSSLSSALHKLASGLSLSAQRYGNQN